jgi:hypothetical protein
MIKSTLKAQIFKSTSMNEDNTKMALDKEKAKKEIINELQKSKEEIATEVIQNSATSSAKLISKQIIKLVLIWKDISLVQNVVEDSKKDFPEIESKLAKLKEGTEKLAKFITDSDQIESSEEKVEVARKISRLISSLNRTYGNTKDMISTFNFRIYCFITIIV